MSFKLYKVFYVSKLGHKSIFFPFGILLFYITVLSSCVTHQNLLNFHGKNDFSSDSVVNSYQQYLLQSGDVLNIKVSSLDEQSVAIFNKSNGQSGAVQTTTESSIFLNSYVISDSGNVNLPVIGNIKLKGHTIEAGQKLLEEELGKYYKYASVDLKLVNFRITVLGEVNRQGMFTIYSSNMNILQALGNAGGITDLGNREKIKIVRKKDDKTTFAYIDLHSKNLISSEYYYLHPNDVIYVEPLKAKARRLDLPVLQVTVSVLTVLILILNLKLVNK